MRKQIWAKELEIISVFDEICSKHGLRYWAAYGTLLGAVRHHGFIPWDDDVDLCMPREDYVRAARIMREELPDPYEWQDLYSNLETCTPEEITTHHLLPFAKICNRMTTAIVPPAMPPVINQGIWIDIFPYDEGFDGQGLTPEAFQIEKALCAATFGKPELKEKLLSPEFEPIMDREDLKAIIEMPMIDRFRIFEQMLESVVGVSSTYSYKHGEIFNGSRPMDKAYFAETLRVPFEGVEIPIPGGYHDLLTLWFGDYRKPVMEGGHITIYNPEVPYTDYFENPDKYIDTLKIGVD
ncbi:MAG: LicD family protein [Lachnospiraceae bacterium]|nr:LicD family protein [Lachnospiraceae bacterium]